MNERKGKVGLTLLRTQLLMLYVMTTGYFATGESTKITADDQSAHEKQPGCTFQLDNLTQLTHKLDSDFEYHRQLVAQINRKIDQQSEVMAQMVDKIDQQNQVIVRLDRKLVQTSNNIAESCDFIPMVRFATYLSIEQTLNSTVVTYRCQYGYMFSSRQMTASSTCTNDSWTPIESSCIESTCPQLQDISNAQLTIYNTSYESEVTITCNAGYQMIDNSTTLTLTCGGEGIWWPQITTPDCKLAGSFPTLTYTIPGNDQVLALTSHNGHLFVTRFGSNQLTVYNTSTFELIRHITVPGANISLLGLAPCPTDDCVYVSDYLNGKVHVVNFQSTINSNSASATSWTVADEPTGLSVNSRGNLLTAHYSGKIQEYTPSGSLVREISTSNKLFHAVEHLNGNLAVSSEEPFVGVLLLSVDGQVLGSYGTTTKDVPTTIAVDKDGFILAADYYNNRVLVINPTLSEARPLPLHVPHAGRLKLPYGLWLDEPRGRLYVGEIRESFRVLVYDNVFNVGADFTT